MAGRILVTGATGTIGGEVVKALVARGAPVRAAVHSLAKGSDLAAAGVETVPFDWSLKSTWPEALKDIASVLLVAPPGDARAHLRLVPFVHGLRAAGVTRVVTLSVVGVETDYRIPLRQIELAVEKSGLLWTHIRPSWLIQSCQSFLYPTLREKCAVFLPTGEGRVGFVDVRDTAEVVAVVLTSPGYDRRTLTLTGPELLSYGEVVGRLREATGKEFRYVPAEPAKWKSTMLSTGAHEESVDVMLWLFEAVRRGRAATLTDDVRAVTGRAPRRLGDYLVEKADLFK